MCLCVIWHLCVTDDALCCTALCRSRGRRAVDEVANFLHEKAVEKVGNVVLVSVDGAVDVDHAQQDEAVETMSPMTVGNGVGGLKGVVVQLEGDGVGRCGGEAGREGHVVQDIDRVELEAVRVELEEVDGEGGVFVVAGSAGGPRRVHRAGGGVHVAAARRLAAVAVSFASLHVVEGKADTGSKC